MSARAGTEPAAGSETAVEPSPATLRDGSTVLVRRSSADDEHALHEFLEGLCLEARRLRFFTGAVDLDEAARLTAASGPDRFGLIALDASGAIVGHALCILVDGDRAEVAVEIADSLHGQGLGTILVERLAELAERRGIARFVAEVLPDNSAMLDVFRDGFDASVAWRGGVEAVEFPTSAWRLARERFPEDDTPGAGGVPLGRIP